MLVKNPRRFDLKNNPMLMVNVNNLPQGCMQVSSKGKSTPASDFITAMDTETTFLLQAQSSGPIEA